MHRAGNTPMAERTGCPFLLYLWSYVEEIFLFGIILSRWQASEAKQSVWTEDCTPSIDYLTRKHLSALPSIVIDINCYHHRSNNLPPYSPLFISLLILPLTHKTPMIPHPSNPPRPSPKREKPPLSHMNYPFFTNSKVLAESCLRDFYIYSRAVGQR